MHSTYFTGSILRKTLDEPYVRVYPSKYPYVQIICPYLSKVDLARFFAEIWLINQKSDWSIRFLIEQSLFWLSNHYSDWAIIILIDEWLHFTSHSFSSLHQTCMVRLKTQHQQHHHHLQYDQQKHHSVVVNIIIDNNGAHCKSQHSPKSPRSPLSRRPARIVYDDADADVSPPPSHDPRSWCVSLIAPASSKRTSNKTNRLKTKINT